MAQRLDPHRLAIGQAVVTTDNADLQVTVTRTDAEHLRIVYRRALTADLLLDVLTRIDGEACRVLQFDRVFWTVTVNGRAATEADVDDLARKSDLQFRFDTGLRQMAIWLPGA